MASPLKTIATKYSKYITPKRLLFRVPRNIQNVSQAREILKELRKYGDMAEYKVIRCPETFQYLNYGFIVYKNSQDADKAYKDRFIKIAPSEVFDRPFEISLDQSTRDAGNSQRRRRQNSNQNEDSDRLSDIIRGHHESSSIE